MLNNEYQEYMNNIKGRIKSSDAVKDAGEAYRIALELQTIAQAQHDILIAAHTAMEAERPDAPLKYQKLIQQNGRELQKLKKAAQEAKDGVLQAVESTIKTTGPFDRFTSMADEKFNAKAFAGIISREVTNIIEARNNHFSAKNRYEAQADMLNAMLKITEKSRQVTTDIPPAQLPVAGDDLFPESIPGAPNVVSITSRRHHH